jgi:hypothetical protein
MTKMLTPQFEKEPKVRIINKETLEPTGEEKLLRNLQVGEVYQFIDGNQSVREVEYIKHLEAGNLLFKDNIIAYDPKGIQNYK